VLVIATAALFYSSEKAANAAKESAEAASASVRAFIDSERGRMFISQFKLIKKEENDPQPTIDYTFINVGRGTVVLIQGSIECELIGSEFPRYIIVDPTKAFATDIAVVAGTLIGSNTQPVSLPPCPPFRTPLTADDYANIAAKKAYILVKGFLRYRTGFDDIYRRNFASIYGARGDKFAGLTNPGFIDEYREPK
jgi:hypothetical protein